MGFECYRIGDLILNAGTQEVSRNGIVVPVPRLSFKLLLSLTRHAPNLVSPEQLEHEVWEGLVVDRGTVNKRVLLLRKALSEDKVDDPYIAVIRGSGYRLVVPVEQIECPPEEAGSANSFPKNWFRKHTGTILRTSYWLLALVVLVILYKGLAPTISGMGEPNRRVAENMMVPVAYSQKSVAVLPFVDLGDGQTYRYLGDGIAEEVISLLVEMDGLEVAARTSSFEFRGATATGVEIAEKLHVGTILEGSVRHSGERIRVTAQLTDVETGYQIWSKHYDRTIDEVFEVQDDIAVNISQSLKLTLDESSRPDSRKSTTGDIEAFALYLKGRELFNDRIHLRKEGLRGALEYFARAIEKDPGFARAHAGIASVYWLLTSYDDSLDEETYLELAVASANFALEIDPDSSTALGVLASVQSLRGNIEQAVALFEQIRALGSSDSNIVHWEAMLHFRLGYFDELIGPLTEVYRLDPLNEHIGWSLATALNFSGQPEKAADILKELEHFTYRQYVIGLTAISKRNYNRARGLLRDVRMRSGVLPAVYADLLVDALEDPGLSDEVAQEFVLACEDGDLEDWVCFESLLMLGSPRVFDLGIDPLSDIARIQIHTQLWNNWATAVRRDPRFKDWVDALGYLGIWRKYGWPDRCRPTGPDDFECI